jgi:DNA repair protein RecO (recombination protein O)
MFKSRAIVIRKTKYSESDLIVQVLTPDGGKVSLMARGAVKSRKRFGGGLLESGNHLEIQYQKSNKPDALSILNEAILIDDFADLRKNYERLELALWIIEIVGKVSQEGDEQSAALFNLLGQSLRALSQANQTEAFQLHFCLRFLHQQGVLAVEGWMQAWLKTPLAQFAQIENEQKFSSAQLHWCKEQVLQYVANASLSSN